MARVYTNLSKYPVIQCKDNYSRGTKEHCLPHLKHNILIHSVFTNIPYVSYIKTRLITSGFVRVLENLESPGILLWHYPGLESPGKRPLVLENSGNLLNSAKKYEVYERQ